MAAVLLYRFLTMAPTLPLEPGYLPDERVVGESLVEPPLSENRKHL